MFRIEYDRDHASAFAVCAVCKQEAPALIWTMTDKYTQCVTPSGWHEYVGADHMLRLTCSACSLTAAQTAVRFALPTTTWSLR